MKLKLILISVIILFSLNMVSAQLEDSNFGLQYIWNEPWARVNDTVKIVGLFINTQDEAVNAKLNVEIYFQGELIDVLVSDELIVEPNSEVNLTVYFRPQFSENYQIKAHAVYDKKVSQTEESSFSVTYDQVIQMGGLEVMVILVGLCGFVIFLHIWFKKMGLNRDNRRYEK